MIRSSLGKVNQSFREPQKINGLWNEGERERERKGR